MNPSALRIGLIDVLMIVVLSVGASGCGLFGGDDAAKPRPLSATNNANSDNATTPTGSLTNSSASLIDARRSTSGDRSGALVVERPRADSNIGPAADPNSSAMQPSAPRVSDVVRDSLAHPATAPSGDSVSMPAPGSRRQPQSAQPNVRAQGAPIGGDMTLGAVVVEVNGAPIFANKILEAIAAPLAAKAKALDASAFKRLAIEEIKKQTAAMIRDELEFATAQRNLDSTETKYAEMLTQRWRDDEVRKAGGSVQVARQQYAAQGFDFDDIVKDRYRIELRGLYYSKKELPKIQVSADDMRHFYQRHLNDQFTERDQAQFRVIKIDFKKTGGRDKALEKAKELQARALRGEDFAQIAGSINDDPFLMKSKGAPSGAAGSAFIDRGAYANTKVEDAVWKLQPGAVSELIESSDAFYIAKLEQKKAGRIASFDEEIVQDRIRKALRTEQFEPLRTAALNRLIKDAIIYPDPPLYEPAIEMAMQKYPQWSGAK